MSESMDDESKFALASIAFWYFALPLVIVTLSKLL